MVFKKELRVLYDERINNKNFIYFKFLIFGRMEIIKRLLFEKESLQIKFKSK